MYLSIFICIPSFSHPAGVVTNTMLSYSRRPALYISLYCYFGAIFAQNNGDQIPMDGGGDWATRHMLGKPDRNT